MKDFVRKHTYGYQNSSSNEAARTSIDSITGEAVAQHFGGDQGQQQTNVATKNSVIASDKNAQIGMIN